MALTINTKALIIYKQLSPCLLGVKLLLAITLITPPPIPTVASNLQHYSQPVYPQLDDDQMQAKTCVPVDGPTPYCNIPNVSYSTVQPFHNLLGHSSQRQAIADLHKYAFFFHDEECYNKIQLFLCSLYVPMCAYIPSAPPPSVEQTIVLQPCRDGCEEARIACGPAMRHAKSDWPIEWDCAKLKYHSEDKLCVVKNTKSQSHSAGQHTLSHSTTQPPMVPSSPLSDPINTEEPVDSKSPDDRSSVNDFTIEAHDNGTMCAEDLFDCKLRDPSKHMNALCIDRSWVCNGKKDCFIEGVDGVISLDEEGCEKKCSEDQYYCEGRCITRADICNGKVDCSLGTDELNCYDYFTGLIQSLLCIFALCVTIYVLFRFIRNDLQKVDDSTSSEDSLDKPRYHANLQKSLEQKHQPYQTPICATSQALDEETNHRFNHNSTPRYNPIYHEPTYAKVARSECYERIIDGGFSGASSVYASYGVYPHMIAPSHFSDDSREPPCGYAAPPPTPAPMDLYVNMNNSPSDMDLLG